MKILKVLINLPINRLIQSFIDYLVDAGHFVVINTQCLGTDLDWLNKYTHNLVLVSQDKLPQIEVDYELRQTTGDRSSKRPALILDFFRESSGLTLSSYRQKEDEFKQIIIKKITDFYPEDHLNFLEAIKLELAELFIDSIIHLAKYTDFNLPQIKQKPAFSQFDALVNYEAKMEALKRYYDSMQGQDELFLISSEFNSFSGLRSECSCQLPLGEREDLELFSLYLLRLLNARKEAIYGYDLLIANKKITKFIHCSFRDNYQSLRTDFHQSRYDVIHEPFYAKPLMHSDVLLAYNEPFQEHKAAVVIHYAVSSEQITISFPTALHFFKLLPQMAEQFLSGLTAFRQGKINLGQFQQLEAERWILLHNTARNFPQKTIHQLVEQQVALSPHAVAVSCQGAQLTYLQLNERANQLAALIREEVARDERLLAFYLDRQLDLAIVILAILKSGHGYVPLGLDYPSERIATVVANCQPALIITQSCYHEKIKECAGNCSILLIDSTECKQKLLSLSTENAELSEELSRLAYVIYTSGTTGIPKGVMIEHKALVNTITYFAEALKFTAADKLLAVTTIAFDIAGLELFLPLICGGEVVIATRQEVMDVARLLQIIDEKSITIMQATPSLWSLLLQDLKGNTLAIRALCGGEALSEALADLLLRKLQAVWNVYGPTETTIWSTINQSQQAKDLCAIGTPIANTECYVLDEQFFPVPAGVIGELFLSGEGLARGYFGDENLSTHQFIQRSFTKNEPIRLYKTGDLVRWLASGKLEFIGRNDYQVKIRGHRIELGDIENALSDFPGVRQCVACVKSLNEEQSSQNNPYLIGYYVPLFPLQEEAIRAHLASKLPEYMLPNSLMALPALPMNANSKLDRNALPIPPRLTSSFLSPRNQLEQKLCLIWEEVLHLPKEHNNVLDDFFRLGGNSISAIQLVNKINQEFQSDIAIRDVFFEKSVANLAACVEKSKGRFLYRDYQITEGNSKQSNEAFPLSNVQQTYYWGRFDHFELSNVSTHVYTEFRYEELDVIRLETTFNQLIQRHPALRTVFTEDKQYFLQQFEPYKIAFYELKNEEELLDLREKYSHKLYSPEVYPLFDVVVSKLANSFVLHLSFDAIIIDMSSFAILFNEWISLYNNPAHPLLPLQINFRDYMLQNEQLRASQLFSQAKNYWQKRLDDYCLELNLPLLTQPAQIKYPRFKRISKQIPKTIWQQITAKAQQLGISLTVIVLEAYARTLGFWSGQQQLTINLTLFNRLPLHAQVDQLIGDFTALELFAYQENNALTIGGLFQQRHQQLLMDIENNLFDGIDFQRLLRQHHALAAEKIISPVVLTSVLNGANQSSLFHLPINSSYQGMHYAISQTSQVWLDNKAYETAEGFVAEWDYVEQLFAPEIIAAMHESYCQVLERLAGCNWQEEVFPSMSLAKETLDVIEKANSFTRQAKDLSIDRAYAEAIERFNVRDRVAVIDVGKDKEYSHGELWQASEQLMQHLLQRGPKGELIAVLSEKGFNQVVASLSIMKAGYAYLPLHADWPLGRLQEVLKQGEVELILLSEKLAAEATLSEFLRQEFAVLVIEEALLSSVSEARTKPLVQADKLAYVIFTSGSTGKPKGVAISHRSALNTLESVNERFAVTCQDRGFALSELSFDLSVYDIYGLLLAGGSVVFPAQEAKKEPAHWLLLIERYQISIWNTVPQLAGLLVDAAVKGLPSLRLFLLSGDWIPLGLPAKIKGLNSSATVMSLGGATEGSIWSIWHVIEEIGPQWHSIPYGVAMPNQKMYVLNASFQHCPVGVKGEICIGGMGVAENYWRDEVLTARQFYQHPTLGRLYRTGDIGRWHADGYIEFCGRDDSQVKMNGYRVELEEITAKLEQLKGIKNAVVRLQKNGEKTVLIAYLVPEKSSQLEPQNNEQFKLKQRGLSTIKDLDYQSPQQLVVTNPNRRKSYRNFIDDAIDITLLKEKANSVLAFSGIKKRNPLAIDAPCLMRLLAPIAGQQIVKKALPKYQYPSAGSSYAIRCLVNIPSAFAALKPGLYYYHPLQQALSLIDSATNSPELELQFTVYWPAIKPLYAEMAKRLAYLEVGHMLHLIFSAIDVEGLTRAICIEDRLLDEENHLLAKLKLNVKENTPFWPAPRLNYLTKKNQTYVDEQQKTVFTLDDFSVLPPNDELRKLLASGQFMITAEGEHTGQHYVMAGFLFQAISQALYKENIGSCMLGFTPNEQAVYAMIVGKITAEEQEKPESHLAKRSLQQVINDELKNSLPAYMLPQAYVILDSLPLSANGKLAINALPLPTLSEEYQPPEGHLEREMVAIWGKVLNIATNSISRTASFFALGGNSLTAMQLLRYLNRDLRLNMRLSDLYQHSTLRDISSNFSSAQEIREEGVL